MELSKAICGPFCGLGSAFSELQSHQKETVYFLLLSFQKFFVPIWLTLEEWKTELILEVPSGFEFKAAGVGI